jgi:ribosomal protein S12 methylthiotransferase accessory factor
VVNLKIAEWNYKEETPLYTIQRIRNTLSSLGLFTVEAVWRNSVEGFYSVSVAIDNTALTTNGKGISCEYALASAYGEMMERLQNFALFRLSLDLRESTLEAKGFYYAPDEKYLSTKELLDSKEDWFQDQIGRLRTDINLPHLLKLWQNVSYEKIPCDFIALPYFNLNRKTLSYIPIKMISKMYMSNGMCAGNTDEEALVQGISEILERHANKRILQERITPPAVPPEYIKQFPKISAMIAAIEAKGSCKILVKDCSLNQNLPVVCVVYIDRGNQSYFVKFGAHPLFEIAVERTLTELLQGQDIIHMMGMRKFSYQPHESYSQDDPISVMVNGSCIYPAEFFGDNSSYAFHEFTPVDASSNQTLLFSLFDLLAKAGYNTYIRNVSFLGFPSFHVIIPGLSEMEEFDYIPALVEYSDYNQAKRLIRNLQQLDLDGCNRLIAYFSGIPYSHDSSIIDLLNLPFNGGHIPWYYSNLRLFLTALYYWKGDISRAYENFNRFLQDHVNNMENPNSLPYYHCVKDYLAARSDGLKENETVPLLSAIYPANMVKKIAAEFSSPSQILDYLGQLHCWNCEHCPFRKNCSYISTEHVYVTLNKQYAANPPDQNRLVNLLSHDPCEIPS